MKKAISLILSVIMLFSITAGIDFSAFAADYKISYHKDNPYYSFIHSSSDHISFSKKAETKASDSATQSKIFYTVADAADYLRAQMVNREEQIEISIQSTESDYNLLIDDIFSEAYSEELSQCSADGDYLRYSWGSYGVDGSYRKYTSYYVYTFTYYVSYYTTAEQEAAIQSEVTKIIQDNSLQRKSDYSKIKRTHDIICNRVEYDYDNLENTEYTLQYTAYAALFDGKSVCQGYALLFYRLAEELGLDSRCITSWDHMWNIVKLDDKYYEVDCTWDDTGYNNSIIYNYFLKGTSDFTGHTREDEFTTSEFNAAYPMAESQYVCSHSTLIWAYEENASCENGFVKAQICTNCDVIQNAVLVPAGKHSYELTIVPPTENEKGFTEYICTVCGYTYTDNITDYASDNSALIAVFEKISAIDKADYSEKSFANLSAAALKYSDYLNQSLPQAEIDRAVYDILSAISYLEPYLNLNTSAKNGTVSVSYNKNTAAGNNASVLFGTEIKLTATPNSGYVFAGWYETVTKRIFSTEQAYTFIITSNTSLEALFIKENSAQLIFTNDNGQIEKIVTKTTSEWKKVSTISNLQPKVPYKLGFTNGRWIYDNAQVLSQLQNGKNVTITPEYDSSSYQYPDIPQPADGTPALELHYQLDAANDIGSFTMALGIPENCRVEAIGIGLYYKNAGAFNPSDFELTINNKMLTSKYDSIDESGIYIVNLHNFTSKYNWAARGYVTYYDANGNLKTAYTNQINIVDRAEIK